jgi:hypothetical protein
MECLTKDEIFEIEKARERIKKGEFYSEKEAREILFGEWRKD